MALFLSSKIFLTPWTLVIIGATTTLGVPTIPALGLCILPRLGDRTLFFSPSSSYDIRLGMFKQIFD